MSMRFWKKRPMYNEDNMELTMRQCFEVLRQLASKELERDVGKSETIAAVCKEIVEKNNWTNLL